MDEKMSEVHSPENSMHLPSPGILKKLNRRKSTASVRFRKIVLCNSNKFFPFSNIELINHSYAHLYREKFNLLHFKIMLVYKYCMQYIILYLNDSAM
jgi:hypothetical protein